MKRPWYRNPAIWILLVTAIPMAIAFVLAPRYRSRAESVLREECRRLYAEARTVADSTAADAEQPIKAKGRAGKSVVTCGELRRRGSLRAPVD